MNYPLIPDNRQEDVSNLQILSRADLVLLMAGNQFMAVPELVRAFKGNFPEVKDVFFATLPPGLELKMILAGGARFRGEEYPIRADVYSSVSKGAMHELKKSGHIKGDEPFVYLHNRLALMVKKGNPKGISNVRDLARDDVRVSQPSPEYEHIAGYVLEMYRQAGGNDLLQKITQDKVKKGTTLMTTVHHRETPARILDGEADAGPVWQTEINEAFASGLDLQGVEIGPDLDQNADINYYITPLQSGRNPENAVKFLKYIKSPEAGALFRSYGFVPEAG